MLIDGEKYACEACVRGHRVSNCQHSDRPLQHINKKGRPVSQCQHCRAMRKSRSSHVKCDCGEKTHKCAHLKQTLEGHKDSCCCNHGGRCTCSHKKEPSLDTVPESDLSDDASAEQLATTTAAAAAKPKPAPRRRRTNTAHSEPILSFDENGHHRPAPRHAKASQKSAPYASLARGVSSSSSSSSMHRTGSTSSLGAKSRTTGSSSPERIITAKSAQASPSISGSSSSFAHLNGQLPPLDLSKIYSTSSSSSAATTFDLFSGVSADYEPPMFSAGLSAASVDWAQYDGLELKGDSSSGLTPSSFDQTHSYLGGLDFGGGSGSTEPTLTSNSGDVSETEDFVSAFSESQFDGFRGSYLGGGMSQSSGSMLAGTSAGAADLGNLDFDQFKATSKLLSTQSSFDDGSSVFPPWVDDEACWGMNNFTDGITHSPDPVASGLWDTA